MTMTRQFYDLPDGRLSAVHINPKAGPPQVVFCNANGFNGLSYRTILEPLGIHAIALDLRGHGMSELPTAPTSLRNWHIFRDDLIYFFENYIEQPVVLAGHSFGAVSAILASGHILDKVSAYVGFDPVTMPRWARFWPYLPGGRAVMKRYLPIARNAGRRRSEFNSLEAALERYQGRGAFKGMPDEVLRDYLDGGLVKHGDKVRLACDPIWEQAIFCAQGHNIYKGARGLSENSTLIYGGKGAVSSKATRAAMKRNMRGGKVIFEKDYHHLFPFHKPDVATSYLRDALTRANLG